MTTNAKTACGPAWRRLAIIGVSTAAVSWGVAAEAAARLAELGGYWTGVGVVTLANGNSERMKCVVTYTVTGQQLKQNVRCASPGYSLNGTAELVVAPGGGVSGSWTENTYSANGSVRGQTTDAGFRLAISGPTFTAVMDATTSACKQTLDIVPTGLDVARISIGLGKC